MNTNLTRNWLEKVADACGKRGADTAADAVPAPSALTKPGEIMSDAERIVGTPIRASLMGTVYTSGIRMPDER